MFSTRLYSEVAASGSVTDDSCCKHQKTVRACCCIQCDTTCAEHITDAMLAWKLLPVTDM